MVFEEMKQKAIADKEAEDKSEIPVIYVGTASCGRAAGAVEILDHLRTELEHKEIRARLMEVGCLGCCDLEPLVTIAKRGYPRVCYGNVTRDIASQLVSDFVINDKPRPDLALCHMGADELDGIPRLSEIPIFKGQVRIALRNCGSIDPGDINHYMAGGGYGGLAKALKMTPQEVIEEMARSGLKGRGGAGFPTADKWRFCRDAPGADKYVICNASAGDPAALADRTLLEGDPHAVLEGLLIAGYAAGAGNGYIFINAEYGLAVARLSAALTQMRNRGLVGDSVLDSGFSFLIEIRDCPGALICGEETAMIRAMEGKRAVPSVRPPFPAAAGLDGKPTVVNNVETLAHVSAILDKGVDWYKTYGTEQTSGTKVITLAGTVRYSGLVEVPVGTTLRRIVYDLGGGIRDGEEFKAVQTGGSTGGWLAADYLDTAVDYEDLTKAGSIMGSGSLVVAGSRACAVDLARHSLSFIETESCGKCVFCREGTMQLAEILTDITEGRGRNDDIQVLIEVGEAMKLGAFCSFGRTAPNPVLTTIRDFRGEYEAHIKDHKCPAGVCKKLEQTPGTMR
jgi:NADH-quinone oxidoreductase subunit F